MDNEKIAGELLKLSKELVGASDIDLEPKFLQVYKSVVDSVAKSISKVKGVESIKREYDKKSGSNPIFAITAKGYTRSDLSVDCTLILQFGPKGYMRIWARRPDLGSFSKEMIEEKFDTVVPLSKIIGKFNIAFG